MCFPQFGQLGPLGQHGFARNSTFAVDAAAPASASAVTLLLVATGEEDARFPHPFELRVAASLSPDGGTLRQDVSVRNTGPKDFEFTSALHTYFAVPDVGALVVEGLSGTTYSDSLDNGRMVEQSGAVLFDREVDRIYLKAPDAGVVAKNAVAPGASVEVRREGRSERKDDDDGDDEREEQGRRRAASPSPSNRPS